jgi:dipeptidyl-peptidase III
MNATELVHFLADQPPSVVRLEIEKHFEALNDKQKRYAHFISKYERPRLVDILWIWS